MKGEAGKGEGGRSEIPAGSAPGEAGGSTFESASTFEGGTEGLGGLGGRGQKKGARRREEVFSGGDVDWEEIGEGDADAEGVALQVCIAKTFF